MANIQQISPALREALQRRVQGLGSPAPQSSLPAASQISQVESPNPTGAPTQQVAAPRQTPTPSGMSSIGIPSGQAPQSQGAEVLPGGQDQPGATNPQLIKSLLQTLAKFL